MINPLHAAARSQDLQGLIAAGHPLVFVAAGEAGPTIVADNTAGIRDAMRHLIGHGHRRIAFIAGSPEDMAGDTGARFQAYRSALQEFGLPPDEHLVAYGRHISAGGYDATRRIMDTGAPFTAILASNDESALGAMEALREAGIRVPQDVAIIGFDDRPESAVQKPALTSVAVPLFEMGYRAVEQLRRQIRGEPPPVEPVKVATHLVPRESCGCGRSGTPQARLPDTSGQVGISEAGEMPGMNVLTLGHTTGSEPEEIRSLRQRLTAAFTASVERNDPAAFPDAVDAAGQPLRDGHGQPYVRVKRFEQSVLPHFLEGPMHALKTRQDAAGARTLYHRVRESPLYDRKLGMYKTNAPLHSCSYEIGRLRAFTPGWLENESIFLHMAYKYLLEVLRVGLCDEFFADLRRGLVPFLNPQTYGRSPLENSSFIVSSAHPDPSLHGRGFVARLTGATAEFLSMWSLMTAGPRPFYMKDGQLCLSFKPTLPRWLFREDGILIFTFLGGCSVTCRRYDTSSDYAQVTAAILYLPIGHRVSLPGDVIGAPYAAMIRNGEIRHIELCLE